MCNRIFSQLDSGFAVGLDYVTSNIGVALLTLNHQTIVAAASDYIFPHLRLAQLGAVSTCDLDAVLMRALYFVLNDVRLVVINLDTHLIQVKCVSDNLEQKLNR